MPMMKRVYGFMMNCRGLIQNFIIICYIIDFNKPIFIEMLTAIKENYIRKLDEVFNKYKKGKTI